MFVYLFQKKIAVDLKLQQSSSQCGYVPCLWIVGFFFFFKCALWTPLIFDFFRILDNVMWKDALGASLQDLAIWRIVFDHVPYFVFSFYFCIIYIWKPLASDWSLYLCSYFIFLFLLISSLLNEGLDTCMVIECI